MSEAAKTTADDLVVTLTREQLRVLIENTVTDALNDARRLQCLRPAGAMALLGVKLESELDHYVDAGRLCRYVLPDGAVRYRERDVLALCDERERGWAAEEAEELLSIYKPHHLYLVEFVGHCVKVGISKNPLARIAQHVAQARVFDREVGRVWVSFLHREACLNEGVLKNRGRSEYLQRSFDDVLSQVLAMPMTRPEVDRG